MTAMQIWGTLHILPLLNDNSTLHCVLKLCKKTRVIYPNDRGDNKATKNDCHSDVPGKKKLFMPSSN